MCLFALFCFGELQKEPSDDWLVFKRAGKKEKISLITVLLIFKLGLTSIEYNPNSRQDALDERDANDNFGHLHAVHLTNIVASSDGYSKSFNLEHLSFDHLIVSHYEANFLRH